MNPTTTKKIDWNAIAKELTGIEIITDRLQVAKLSLDYYHFSPILQAQLKDKRGDIVVRPQNETEVIAVARTCV